MYCFCGLFFYLSLENVIFNPVNEEEKNIFSWQREGIGKGLCNNANAEDVKNKEMPEEREKAHTKNHPKNYGSKRRRGSSNYSKDSTLKYYKKKISYIFNWQKNVAPTSGVCHIPDSWVPTWVSTTSPAT